MLRQYRGAAKKSSKANEAATTLTPISSIPELQNKDCDITINSDPAAQRKHPYICLVCQKLFEKLSQLEAHVENIQFLECKNGCMFFETTSEMKSHSKFCVKSTDMKDNSTFFIKPHKYYHLTTKSQKNSPLLMPRNADPDKTFTFKTQGTMVIKKMSLLSLRPLSIRREKEKSKTSVPNIVLGVTQSPENPDATTTQVPGLEVCPEMVPSQNQGPKHVDEPATLTGDLISGQTNQAMASSHPPSVLTNSEDGMRGWDCVGAAAIKPKPCEEVENEALLSIKNHNCVPSEQTDAAVKCKENTLKHVPLIGEKRKRVVDDEPYQVPHGTVNTSSNLSADNLAPGYAVEAERGVIKKTLGLMPMKGNVPVKLDYDLKCKRTADNPLSLTDTLSKLIRKTLDMSQVTTQRDVSPTSQLGSLIKSVSSGQSVEALGEVVSSSQQVAGIPLITINSTSEEESSSDEEEEDSTTDMSLVHGKVMLKLHISNKVEEDQLTERLKDLPLVRSVREKDGLRCWLRGQECTVQVMRYVALLPNLRECTVPPGFSNSAALRLRQASDLRVLGLAESNVKESSVRKLLRSCPRLEWLEVSDCPLVSLQLICDCYRAARKRKDHPLTLDMRRAGCYQDGWQEETRRYLDNFLLFCSVPP